MTWSSDTIRFTCLCGQPIEVPAADTVTLARCARCGAEIEVGPATAEPAGGGFGLLDDAKVLVPRAAGSAAARTTCSRCGAPLDLEGAERRGELFVVCEYCGSQNDRNDSLALQLGEVLPAGEVETTTDPLPAGAPVARIWEMDGKRFKTLDALERHLRAHYPAEVAEQLVAALRGPPR